MDGDVDPLPPGPDTSTDIDDNWYGEPTTVPPVSEGPPLGSNTADAQRDAVPSAEDQLLRAAAALEQAENATGEQIVGLISAPWATDAADAPVPVNLSVVGNDVTMNVDHNDAQLPVIADPVYVNAAAARTAPATAAGVDCRDCPAGHSPCGSYDPWKAITYARTYAVKFNTQWTHFAPNDCTNFASQVLLAGGMNMMREFQRGQGSWWGIKGGDKGDTQRNTESWRLAKKFTDHLLEYGLAVHTNKWYGGDIVYWNWHDGGSSVDHISIVTGITNGKVYLGGHGGNKGADSNYAAKTVEEVKKRVKKHHPKYSFARLHIRHTKANIN
jgi:hypothetical protein